MRIFLQIQIPVGLFVFPPIGFDDQILSFMEEIGNGDQARPSRFSPDGFQEQNRLRTKFASDPSVRLRSRKTWMTIKMRMKKAFIGSAQGLLSISNHYVLSE